MVERLHHVLPSFSLLFSIVVNITGGTRDVTLLVYIYPYIVF